MYYYIYVLKSKRTKSSKPNGTCSPVDKFFTLIIFS